MTIAGHSTHSLTHSLVLTDRICPIKEIDYSTSFNSRPLEAEDVLLHDIIDYIDGRIGDYDLGERMIRSAFNLSRATLYRRFQPLGGIASFIRDKRLQLAHMHLRGNPTCSLTWLLYEVGFSSERQFQRSFQARYGMSPANWRKSCQLC